MRTKFAFWLKGLQKCAKMASPTPDLIQDITTRFILTAPAEQLMFFESIMFLVEQAHWYYEDYVRDQDNSLKSLGLKDFAIMVFENCPELSQHRDDIEQIMEHFKAFKKNVPVMGSILLDQNMQRVLLVKGWKNSSCWGFPRGKIHKNETDAQCAVREVLEETGYDIEELVKEEDFIELTLDGKRNKLYIVAGLDPNSAQFAPKCKGEIGGYAWHRIADLPATREEGSQTFVSDDGTKHKFFMVWPYLKPLRKWIKKQQRGTSDGMWDMPPAMTPPPAQDKQQRNNPEDLWDMPPVMGTPPPQQKQQQQNRFQQKPKQQRNKPDELWDMPPVVGTPLQQQESPLPQQVQQLAASERRTGNGGSPKHMLHASFHEAALAQARQRAEVSTGPRLAPGGTGPTCGAARALELSASNTEPLAKFFGGAVPQQGRADNSSNNSARGADALSCSPGNFTFKRQPILHALAGPAGPMAAPLRVQISGRG